MNEPSERPAQSEAAAARRAPHRGCAPQPTAKLARPCSAVPIRPRAAATDRVPPSFQPAVRRDRGQTPVAGDRDEPVRRHNPIAHSRLRISRGVQSTSQFRRRRCSRLPSDRKHRTYRRRHVHHRQFRQEHRAEHQHHLASHHRLRYQRHRATRLRPRLRRDPPHRSAQVPSRSGMASRVARRDGRRPDASLPDRRPAALGPPHRHPGLSPAAIRILHRDSPPAARPALRVAGSGTRGSGQHRRCDPDQRCLLVRATPLVSRVRARLRRLRHRPVDGRLPRYPRPVLGLGRSRDGRVLGAESGIVCGFRDA